MFVMPIKGAQWFWLSIDCILQERIGFCFSLALVMLLSGFYYSQSESLSNYRVESKKHKSKSHVSPSLTFWTVWILALLQILKERTCEWWGIKRSHRVFGVNFRSVQSYWWFNSHLTWIVCDENINIASPEMCAHYAYKEGQKLCQIDITINPILGRSGCCLLTELVLH